MGLYQTRKIYIYYPKIVMVGLIVDNFVRYYDVKEGNKVKRKQTFDHITPVIHDDLRRSLHSFSFIRTIL